MKLKSSDLEFWMSDDPLINVDLYQPREDLNGYCLASVIANNPKEF